MIRAFFIGLMENRLIIYTELMMVFTHHGMAAIRFSFTVSAQPIHDTWQHDKAWLSSHTLTR